MAHYGTGPSGYILTTDGLKQVWDSGSSGGLTAIPDPLTVNDLQVNNSATLPPFSTLSVASGGQSSLATVVSGVWNASVIDEIYGGTGRATYVAGDILYADGVTSLATLPSGAEGTALQINAGSISWVTPSTPAVANQAGVTVGGSGTSECPSPDYATIGEAVAAGHASIDVVSDTIETSQISSASSGLFIRVHNATIHMLDVDFNIATGGLRLEGRGEIRANGTTAAINGAGLGTGRVVVDGVSIDGSNSTAAAINTSSIEVSLSNLDVNVGTGGSNVAPRISGPRVNNVVLTGDSSANGVVLLSPGLGYGVPSTLKSATIAGTWQASATVISSSSEDGIVLDGIGFNMDATTVRFSLDSNSKISSLYRDEGLITLSLTDGAKNITMSDCVGGFGELAGSPTLTVTDSMFSNVVASGSEGLLSANLDSARLYYSNCQLGRIDQVPSAATMEVHGTDCKWENTTFQQDLSVQGSGHIFTSCTFLGDVTLQANTNGVGIFSSRVDGTFTDNGTNNAASLL